MSSSVRLSRRIKRRLSDSEEDVSDIDDSVSNETPTKRRTSSLSNHLQFDSMTSKIPPHPHDTDIRKSVPYFLPPPPVPAAMSPSGNNNNAIPMGSNWNDPYMGFIPFSQAQYSPAVIPPPPPPQHNSIHMHPPPPPPPPPPPLPFPFMLLPQQFPPFLIPMQQFAQGEKIMAPQPKKRIGSLELLADLSDIVGRDSSELKQIQKTLLVQQYQKSLALTSKLFQFIKGIINGSEMAEGVELVTASQLLGVCGLSKDLNETLNEWKELLEPDSSRVLIESNFQLSTVENSIFGLNDPNVSLVLPPYIALNNIKKKNSETLTIKSLSSWKRKQDQLEYESFPFGKCDQCEADETIQWRRGPNGERSLCNACGLFYTKLVRKMGTKLAGKLLAQRKAVNSSSDRRVPPALLGDEIVHYYLVEDVESGEMREMSTLDFKDKKEWFDCSVEPAVLKRKLIMMPLLEKLAEVVPDVSNMNSKYDPSHEIKKPLVEPVPQVDETKEVRELQIIMSPMMPEIKSKKE